MFLRNVFLRQGNLIIISPRQLVRYSDKRKGNSNVRWQLRARLRLPRGIGSLLLSLFLDNAIGILAFPFALRDIAIGAATLAFPPE